MNNNDVIIIDGHCDTLKIASDENLTIANTKYSFNLTDANIMSPYIQFLASFINPKNIKKTNSGFKITNTLLTKYYNDYEIYKDNIINILSSKDILSVQKDKKIGILLSIENGSAINGNIRNLVALYNKGIRAMSLTWNNDNELGCGAFTTNDTGLTNIGLETIKKMEDLHMIIDVSHLSVKTFYDVINNTTSPIVATHSCVKSLCNHVRNLSDEQIKNIAYSKGIIGICFYNQFLTNNEKATSDDIIHHIEYIANLVGIDYIGLGSDFDGIDKEDLPFDILGIKDLYIIFDKLLSKGFSTNDIYKIAGMNYVRVLNSILN